MTGNSYGTNASRSGPEPLFDAVFSRPTLNGAPMPAGTCRANLHAYLPDAWGNPMGKDYIFEFTYAPPAA